MSWNLDPRRGKYSKKPWHKNAWVWFGTASAARAMMQRGKSLGIPCGDFKLMKMTGPHVTNGEKKRKWFRITIRLTMIKDEVQEPCNKFLEEIMAELEFKRYQVPL